MLEPGRKYDLIVVKETSFGLYLAEEMNTDEKNRILLPGKQVPEGTGRGDRLRVFVYRDSSDRPIATTHEPKLMLGQTGVLTVRQVTRIGAFLDWGLEKDLLLPYHEQTRRVREGEDCLVALYLDKSHRLCATMKVYHYLSTRSPYSVGDMVTGRVYEISGNFGVFAAVDDQYSALIPRQEANGTYQVGDLLQLRVTEVKEDGKLTVSDRKKAYLQMEDDGQMILDYLAAHKGELPFDDKAAPGLISQTFGLSKNAFKRAVGHLLKEGKISLGDGKITMVRTDSRTEG